MDDRGRHRDPAGVRRHGGISGNSKGFFTAFEGDAGKVYFNCIVQDATACCAQGLELERSDRYVYPDDYPQPGKEITVQGTFDMYQEEHDGNSYYYLVLRNAELV